METWRIEMGRNRFRCEEKTTVGERSQKKNGADTLCVKSEPGGRMSWCSRECYCEGT